MSAIKSIRIDQTLYTLAKADAATEHRTIAGQLEFWDLPVNFIAESLMSMAEPREKTPPLCADGDSAVGAVAAEIALHILRMNCGDKRYLRREPDTALRTPCTQSRTDL